VWNYWQRNCPGKPIITRLGGDLRVRIYPHDVIGKNIYIDGVFEPDCWNFVKKFLKLGMIVFDLGANLGQYTLLAARCVGQQGQVHSFEPSHRMFRELKFNVELNGLSQICVLNDVAVCDTCGTAKLSRYEQGAEVYGSLGSHKRKEGTVVGYEEVKTMRLDDYVQEMGIYRVDFMKIDIEGAELFALQGGEKLLLRSDAPTILLELADVNTDGFGYKAIETWDYLESLGYRMRCFDSHGNISGLAERPLDFVLEQNLVAIKLP
jgi:FkbM family methyltransferase